MNARVDAVVNALARISLQYPEEDIVIWLRGGLLTVGFAKTPCGDKQNAEWGKVAPLLEFHHCQ